MRRRLAGLALAAFCALAPATAPAQPVGSFADFVAGFEARAAAAGVPPGVYRAAMAGVAHDPAIARLIAGQPEFTTPVWEYLDARVSAARIARGQAAFAANRALFERIGAATGVDPYVLAAIWGIESDFGGVLANGSLIRPVIPSLATLVYERRGRLAEDEALLIDALRLIARGDYTAQTLVGSWAGAVGHLQTNTSVIVAHGRDGDGDGRIDPHASLADALATAATALRSYGYVPGVDWGFEVELPEGFDYLLATREEFRPVRFFAERGVTRVAGRAFADLDQPVFLYLPAGRDGPKFLMTPNYLAFKGYNFSDSYALAVAHLTDRLKGSGPFVASWPRDTRFPNLEQRLAIQRWLAALGHYHGEIDGRIGPITQDAYQRFQAASGLVPDGFVTLDAFERLRAAVQ